MKSFVLCLLFLTSTAYAQQCLVRETSQMTSNRTVGPVTDLVKIKGHNKCQVKYRINVDGAWHNVDETYTGYYQTEILCAEAIQTGKNALLVTLPGKFKTETLTVCAEKPKMLAKGYEGLENEFGSDPAEYKGYFKVGAVSKCRYFKDFYSDGVVIKSKGIICLNKTNLWTVVDKS